jgi:hypothetical protein
MQYSSAEGPYVTWDEAKNIFEPQGISAATFDAAINDGSEITVLYPYAQSTNQYYPSSTIIPKEGKFKPKNGMKFIRLKGGITNEMKAQGASEMHWGDAIFTTMYFDQNGTMVIGVYGGVSEFSKSVGMGGFVSVQIAEVFELTAKINDYNKYPSTGPHNFAKTILQNVTNNDNLKINRNDFAIYDGVNFTYSLLNFP